MAPAEILCPRLSAAAHLPEEVAQLSRCPRIIVVGAGPTGIGAAWRLAEHGHDDWLLVEGSAHVGGLASSIRDAAGFTWDLGGHVLFSHYRYFDHLMHAALGDHWVEHQREAWVRIRDRWIPYPFQNNLWRLPTNDIALALRGLEAVAAAPPNGFPPSNFREWLLSSFGDGLCELFMFPYNRKVWAFDPVRLGVGWMGERVATVDLARVRRNVELRRDDVGWGPNATFRFPLHGGTGAIWRSLANQLPRDRVALGREMVGVDTGARVLRFADGSSERYERLVSTMPLDRLLRMLHDRPELQVLADRFVHSSSHIIGIGLAGQVPDSFRTKCWMYFPDQNTPFYRATVFSNYSPNNVPDPGRQWSLMAEVSESTDKPVDDETIVHGVIEGFRRADIIDRDSRILSRWHRRLEYGYPTPWLGRDDVLDLVEPELLEAGIHSRGRFGAWRYEVSNQDHSAMQGVEVIDHILLGTPETTVRGRMDAEPPRLRDKALR